MERRVRARGEFDRQRLAHQRRGIVGEGDERQVDLRQIVRRQVAVEAGAGERGGGGGAIRGRRIGGPGQELANHHETNTLCDHAAPDRPSTHRR